MIIFLLNYMKIKNLTNNVKEYLSGLDIIGEIAIIKIKEIYIPHKNQIGNLVIDNFHNIKSVFLQESSVEGEYRLKKLSYLSGINNSVTLYRESGCNFLLDVTKVYFSPRLSSERLRIAKLVNSDEKILNMFAGVSPFSIIISKYNKNCQIVDIELNPSACIFAKENYSLNKTNNIVSICGDSKSIIREKFNNTFDRILMPLPENSIDFLEDAIFAINKNGGWIHLYSHINCNSDNVLEYASSIFDSKISTYGEIKFLRIVKHIGPGWYQIVFDIKINKK